MFGKLKETVPVQAQLEGTKNRETELIESIIRFTGAATLEELEEIVKGAEELAGKEKASEDEILFGAVSAIKNNRSLIEAKEMEKNGDFVNAVLAGFDAEKAYILANCERLLQEAYAEGERQGKLSVITKKDRVDEEGMKVAGGYKAEIDPANMTMDDLKKIKERLKKGENVRL